VTDVEDWTNPITLVGGLSLGADLADWTEGVEVVAGGGAGDFTKISGTVLGSPATDITFSSISGGFSQLCLVVMGRCSDAVLNELLMCQFNGDTGFNYDYQYLQATGNTTSGTNFAAELQSQAAIGLFPGANATVGLAGSTTVWFPFYAGTTFWKTFNGTGMAEWNHALSSSQAVVPVSGMWASTAAITSIKVFPADGSNLLAGSGAVLYGVN